MDQVPPILELVPKIKGFWCTLLMFGCYGALTWTPWIAGVWIGYAHNNMWVGIAFFLFLTLVSGVICSKMRVCSIPYEQREMNYSTMAIVKWYLAKNICLKN